MHKPLTQDIRADRQALSLDEYLRCGGYQAIRKALVEMTPAEVTAEVEESRLRGRGGAGFPTGLKWSFVPKAEVTPQPRYVVANGDELEPGAFKDRLLMESHPHQLLEGILLAAYAIQAEKAYVFIRWAYREAIARVEVAISEARQADYLGANILGSEFSCEVHLHASAGRYMCGEETGLLNSLEGKRATPRSKPPFPPVVGLFGKPTVVQNIETLCCVPHIVNKGAQWFRGLSRCGDGGTKIYGVSGRVARPGLFELPLGATAGEIVEEHAGGMCEGYRLRAFLPGGASTDFLTAENLDAAMDYETIQQAGSRLGTGTMILLDDRTCPVGMVHNLEHFFAQESCGFCTPCRDGLPWVEKILAAIERGEGRPEDMEVLAFHCRFLGPGFTFCALAPGAVEPLQSALELFRDDFERHIREGHCPWN